jgi:hypothetical protein
MKVRELPGCLPAFIDPPMAMVEYVRDITAAANDMTLNALKLGHCIDQDLLSQAPRGVHRDKGLKIYGVKWRTGQSGYNKAKIPG